MHHLTAQNAPGALHDPDGQALRRLGLTARHSAQYLVRPDGTGDLLTEGLHRAAQGRAAHPADPHPDQDAAAADGNVRRRPLALLVRRRFGAAPRAPHRPVLDPRPHADHLARVLDILDDEGRQPRKHSPHKLCHQLADYEPWFDNHRRLRELITELETLSLDIAEADPHWNR